MLPIRADDHRPFLTSRFGLGQMVVFDLLTVAFVPDRGDYALNPLWSNDRKTVQGRPQRFSHLFEPVEHPHGGEHLGGIRPLSASCLEQTQFLKP